MKYFLTLLSLTLIQGSFNVYAETEEEEMARMQRQLNNNLFGFGNEDKPKPATPPPAAKPTAPPPVESAKADTSGIDLTKFTNYKLAGLSLGKAEQAAIDMLTSKGYNCNIQKLAGAYAMLGKKVCVSISAEDPKMAMIGFSGGQLSDLETHETFTTGFPEKFFTKAKAKFMDTYGSDANCKAKGKGEICEVFGHGYRVLFRTETQGDDKAKIINRIAKM